VCDKGLWQGPVCRVCLTESRRQTTAFDEGVFAVGTATRAFAVSALACVIAAVYVSVCH